MNYRVAAELPPVDIFLDGSCLKCKRYPLRIALWLYGGAEEKPLGPLCADCAVQHANGLLSNTVNVMVNGIQKGYSFAWQDKFQANMQRGYTAPEWLKIIKL